MIIAFPPPNVQIFTEPPPPTSPGVVILRQEVWGPTEELESGARYVFRVPTQLKWDTAVIEVKQAGEYGIDVRLGANGNYVFEETLAPNQTTLRIPRDQWNVIGANEQGVLPQDAEVLLILIVGSPPPYSSPWTGMAVSLVKES